MAIRFNTIVAAVLLAGLMGGCERFQSAATQIDKANAALEKNDSASAVIHLKNALQKEPDNARARYLLGKTYLDRNEVQNAEKELQRAQGLKFDNDLVLPLLAKALVLSGNQKELQNLDAQSASSAKVRAEVTAWRANGLLSAAKLKEAQMLYDEAIKLDPESVTARYGLARLAAANGNTAQADAIAAEILKTSPHDIETLLFRSDVQKFRGNLPGAIDFVRQALEVNPQELRARIALGMLALESGQLDEALKQSAELKKRHPNSAMGPYLDALVELRNKKVQAAQTEIQKALKLAPNYVPALLVAATVELISGSPGQAEQHLKTAISQSPGNPLVQRAMARLHLRTGRPANALELLKPLLEKAPDNVELHGLLGEAYFQLGDMDNANQHFARAAQSSTYAQRALTGMAITHIVSGDLDKAVAELESATKAEGPAMQADLMLIATRTQQREYDKALAAIDALAKKMPAASPIPHALRAQVAMAREDRAQARTALELALKADPNYFFAVRALAAMDQTEKKPDQAQKRLEDFSRRNDKNAEALIVLAEFKTLNGAASDEVVALLKRAQAAEPQKHRATEVLTRYLLATKQPKEALDVVQRALGAAPDEAVLIDLQGIVHATAGRPADAVASYTRLSTLQPKNELAWARLAQAQANAGDHKAALVSINRALGINPKNPALIETAVALRVANKQFSEALALARETQKTLPKAAVGYVLEGDVLGTQKQYLDAVSRFDQALKIQPDPAVFIRKHQALGFAGKANEAGKAMSDWFKANPKDVYVHQYAADLAMQQKAYAPALLHYKAVLERQPANMAALNNIAWLLNEKKDPAALEYINKALQLQPKQPAFLDTRGMIHLGRGNTAEALKDLKLAAEYAPGNPEIHLNYARALLKSGNKDEARRELEVLKRMGAPGAKALEALTQELG